MQPALIGFSQWIVVNKVNYYFCAEIDNSSKSTTFFSHTQNKKCILTNNNDKLLIKK